MHIEEAFGADVAPLPDELENELISFVETHLFSDGEQNNAPEWVGDFAALVFNAGRAYERGTMTINVEFPVGNAQALINYLLGGQA